ncbi:COPII coat assembly protein SEC16 [Escovopsis weberi]|uniref:COPII coat assembly protein SEC16 n=1 Tax=Escovopsis weberi TaxID=150374 RepID=A0A0M8N5Y2_ESCWE|nr:COPII coat assembly protein SEC16 [Escovopsis weberi]
MSADDETKETGNGGVLGGYEPPSTQSYGYEPPSYGTAPDTSAKDDDEDDAPKPKKKSFMDDDDDDLLATPTTQNQSRTDRDRENDELFRKAAEEDAKRATAQQASKKGWGFTSWFGGSKKEGSGSGESTPGKPIKAKLGEASSFVYDPDLKRWINKKPGAENVEAKSATPPPPKGGAPRSVSGTPPMRAFTPPPAAGRASVPPTSAPAGGLLSPAQLKPAASQEQLGPTPAMLRSASNADAANGQANGPASGPPSRPPSRPATSVSNASSIDDLLSTSGPRKPGQKKARKGGRYVDVMAK